MVDRDGLVERYAGGVAAVRAALAGASDAELDARPADGGWTAREVVHHLADSESRSMIRLRQLLAEDSPEIQVYDQDEWASRLPYGEPIDAALALFDAARAFSLATLQTLEEGAPAWTRAGRHVEWDEPYTPAKWLEIYAEHPYEHAEQIRAARSAAPR